METFRYGGQGTVVARHRYRVTLSRAVRAAEEAFRTLRIQGSATYMSQSWAAVEARRSHVGPMRIMIFLERPPDRILVNFQAGTRDSPANRNAAFQLKTTFEDRLTSAPGPIPRALKNAPRVGYFFQVNEPFQGSRFLIAVVAAEGWDHAFA